MNTVKNVSVEMKRLQRAIEFLIRVFEFIYCIYLLFFCLLVKLGSILKGLLLFLEEDFFQ